MRAVIRASKKDKVVVIVVTPPRRAVALVRTVALLDGSERSSKAVRPVAGFDPYGLRGSV